MRCMTLADTLSEAGWRCLFVTRRGTAQLVAALGRSKHDHAELGDDEWASVDALRNAAPQACDLVVIDHHGLGGDYETRCRGWAGRILAIEDLGDRRHDCDILVDTTPGRSPDDYLARVPTACRLLLGPTYALLRRQFMDARAGALVRRRSGSPVERILVGFGAVDGKNMTGIALRALEEARIKVPVDVVLGAGAAGLEEVRRLMTSLSYAVEVHLDAADVASLAMRSDLAIGAVGSASWERCCLGLPSIIVTTADNQRATATALTEAGAAASAGDWLTVSPATIAERVRALVDDAAARRRMAEAAAALCDGGGVSRVAAILHGGTGDERSDLPGGNAVEVARVGSATRSTNSVGVRSRGRSD